MAKPAPETVTELTVKRMFPMLLNVTVWNAEVFSVWLPKLIEVGEDCRAGSGFTPEPTSGTLIGTRRAGLEIVSAPFAEAAVAGAKTTFMLILLPGASTTGAFAESSEKLAPVI